MGSIYDTGKNGIRYKRTLMATRGPTIEALSQSADTYWSYDIKKRELKKSV